MRTTIRTFLLLLGGMGSLAGASEFHVNNVVGDDRASGLAAEPGPIGGPVRTIQRALCLAGPGDRLVLANAGQVYHESLCLSGRHHGHPGKPFVVEGGGATLDGTVRAARGAWRHHRDNVFAMRPRRLAFQQVFRDGQPLVGVKAAGWLDSEPALEPLEWALYQGEILLRVEKGKLPSDYQLRHAGLQTGVTLYNTEHVRVENLVVQGFQQDGLNAHDTVRDCQIIDVESRANGRSGVSLGGTSRVELKRVSLYDNGRAQLRIGDVARATLTDCDIDESGAEPIDIRGGQLSLDGEPYELLER